MHIQWTIRMFGASSHPLKSLMEEIRASALQVLAMTISVHLQSKGPSILVRLRGTARLPQHHGRMTWRHRSIPTSGEAGASSW